MIKCISWTLICVMFLLTRNLAVAQTFTRLLDFNGSNGSEPEYVSLVQGIDGDLYGTTYGGTAGNSSGTVFKITLEGNLTTLLNFSDSGLPAAGLVLGLDGNFYGTMTYALGSVFRITPQGSLTTLHSKAHSPRCTVSTVMMANGHSTHLFKAWTAASTELPRKAGAMVPVRSSK